MRPILSLLLVLGISCGGDDDAGSSSLLGIYEKTSWTLRDSGGCDSEGPSILQEAGRDPYFVVYVTELLGIELLVASHCPTVMDCREATDSIDLLGYGFDSGSDSSGWTGSGATAGGSGDGTCSGEARDFTLEASGDDEVTISVVSTDAGDFPEDDEGFCTTEGAKEAAEGMPCTGLERFAGTLAEEL